jgi:hypothetical protein
MEQLSESGQICLKAKISLIRKTQKLLFILLPRINNKKSFWVIPSNHLREDPNLC